MTFTDDQITEMVAEAQAFRGASDQYAEFIVELADALAQVKDERDEARAPATGSGRWLAEHEKEVARVAWYDGFGVGERSGVREFPLDPRAENPHEY